MNSPLALKKTQFLAIITLKYTKNIWNKKIVHVFYTSQLINSLHQFCVFFFFFNMVNYKPIAENEECIQTSLSFEIFMSVDILFVTSSGPTKTLDPTSSLREKCLYLDSCWIRRDTGYQSECRKMRTRITPNAENFSEVPTWLALSF